MSSFFLRLFVFFDIMSSSNSFNLRFSIVPSVVLYTRSKNCAKFLANNKVHRYKCANNEQFHNMVQHPPLFDGASFSFIPLPNLTLVFVSVSFFTNCFSSVCISSSWLEYTSLTTACSLSFVWSCIVSITFSYYSKNRIPKL